jgi:hypothetical protein
MLEISKLSKEALKSIDACQFLEKEDKKALFEMGGELQETWEKRQLWRTETEMRVSVLNDIKHPDKASKYWQATKEQSVFFLNLVDSSFEYRRTINKIKRVERAIGKAEDELEKEELEIDLEELLFKKRNQELEAKDRMREIKLWSKIKDELEDGSFNSEDVNENQLVSLGKRTIRELKSMDGATLTGGEMANKMGVAISVIKQCDEKGLLQKIAEIPEAEEILPRLGYKKG